MKKIGKEKMERYLRGEETLNVKEFGEWYCANMSAETGSDAAAEKEFKKFWDHSLNTATMSGSELDRAYGQTVAKMAGERPASRSRRLIRSLTRVAAVLTIPLLAATVYFGWKYLGVSEPQWVEVYTRNGETRQVSLPDGSEVWMNAGTHLIYLDSFRKERRVFVSGEIFLDVVPDARRMFTVDTHNMSVNVHGTSFNVRSYADDRKTETSLVEGSISLQIKNRPETNEIFMLPGERVYLDNETLTINKETFNIANYTSWCQNHYSFRHKTLPEITRELERIFDAQIVIRDAELMDDTYFVTFGQGLELDRMLEALNVDKQLDIRRDGQIIEIRKRNPR